MSNKNKKILFLINNLSRGGAEGVFVNDCNALVKSGFDCQIAFIYSGKSDQSVASGLCLEKDKIWKFNFKNLYDVNSYVALVKKVKSENINLVYSTLDDANFIAKIVSFFAPFKLFCREANMTEEKPFKFKIADLVLNFKVYKLIMVAKAVLESYVSYDFLRRDKMKVLYNGVFIPEIPKKHIHQPIKILAVGSFTPKKGFLDLIEILRSYLFEKIDFELNIIGNGALFDNVNEKIKEYGMDNKIKCIGAMNKEEIQKYYLNSDIFLLSSKREGCPNVLLEAMSYSLAPVCFSVGAVPEIISNNLSGIVVPLGDKKAFGLAIVDLIENKEKIEKIGLEARKEVIKRFSYDIHIKNLLNVLELNI